LSETAQGFPTNVVAFGGGTGLPAVLRGLRGLLQEGKLEQLTAVVTMTDDGGSSGRLRRSRGVLPPGDLRNCLVALANEEDLMARLFQHRYEGAEGELAGHAVGNLILTALAEQSGCFLNAVEMSSRVLNVVGRILPVTLTNVSLQATLVDGSTVLGETKVGSSGAGGIRRVRLSPELAEPTPGVLESIRDADLIVLGPGSLYTSVVPILLVDGVAEAMRSARAPVLLVGNIVSEPGETDRLGLADHLRVIEQHAGGNFIDGLVLHEGAIPAELLARYERDGARVLNWNPSIGGAPSVQSADLVAAGDKIRHDPEAVAGALVSAWRKTQAPRLEKTS